MSWRNGKEALKFKCVMMFRGHEVTKWIALNTLLQGTSDMLQHIGIRLLFHDIGESVSDVHRIIEI